MVEPAEGTNASSVIYSYRGPKGTQATTHQQQGIDHPWKPRASKGTGREGERLGVEKKEGEGWGYCRHLSCKCDEK